MNQQQLLKELKLQGISDKILNAIEETPRELFIPDEYKDVLSAYVFARLAQLEGERGDASDGFEEFNGRVIPGDVYTYSGEDSIELVSGNGAALEVYFNQEYLGNLGSVGEVINLSFSRQGLSTSTPEPTSTPAEVLMPVATEAFTNLAPSI